MAVRNPVAGVQTRTDNDAITDRRDRTNVFVQDSTGKPRPGLIPTFGGQLAVTAGAGLSVNVAAGACVIPAPTAGHGGWQVVNDAALNIVLDAAHPTNARIDLIIARVADPFYYTGGDGAASIKKVTGTASTSPLAPTVPTTDGAYIVLRQVTVPAAATSSASLTIALPTAGLPYTAAAGGRLTVASATERDAYVTASAPVAGTRIYRSDLGEEDVWTGSQWLTVLQNDMSTYSVGLSQTSGIPGTGSGYWQRSGHLVHAEGTVTTTGPHPGGTGRIIFNLPVPHVYGSTAGVALGSFSLFAGANGTFAGTVVTYASTGSGALFAGSGSGAGFVGDNNAFGANFDLPSSSTLSFNINYRAA